MWICKNCDKLLDDCITLCPDCGTTPPQPSAQRNCVACRSSIPAECLYCPKCGSFQRHKEQLELACTLKQVNAQWTQSLNAANNLIKSWKNDVSGNLLYDGERVLFTSPGNPSIVIELKDVQWAVLSDKSASRVEILFKHKQASRYVMFSTANVAAARQLVDTVSLRVK